VRYFLHSLPPLIILISYGFIKLSKKFKITLLLLFILPVSFFTAINYHRYYSHIGEFGQFWQLGQFIPENATNKEIAEYISFNSEPNLFPYIKIQKDAFEYINKNYPDAIVFTDWITAFKISSPPHGWSKVPLTILGVKNLNIAEIGSNGFDLILEIKGDGFDYRKSDLVEKALDKFNVILIKEWKYKNMSIEIYENNEK